MGNGVNSLTIGHYRQILSELQTGITERVQREQALASHDDGGNEASPFKLERQLRILADDFQQAEAAADEAHAAFGAALDDQMQSAVANVRAEYCRIASQIEGQFSDDLAKVEKKYQENSWLLDSIHDDNADSSPQGQFAKLKSQIQLARERLAVQLGEIETTHEQALALAEKCRQRIGPEPETGPLPKSREEAGRIIAAGTEVVRERYEQLSRQIVPRLFAGWTSLIAGAFVWGGVAAAVFLLIDPLWLGFKSRADSGFLLLCVGAGLVGAFVILLVAWNVAAQQTAEALDSLRQNLVDARASFTSWGRFAAADLQRCEQEFRTRQVALVERRERSLQQFSADRDARVRELEIRRRQQFHEAAHRRESALREVSERRNQDLLALQAAHREATIAGRAHFENERTELSHLHEQQFAEISAQRQELWNLSVTGWLSTRTRLADEVAALHDESRPLAAAWDEIESSAWQPPQSIPAGLHFGHYELRLAEIAGAVPEDARMIAEDETYLLPAVLPFPNAPSLILKVCGEGRENAVEILQVAMLRLLTQLPPGDVRFTIIDPVGLGENFAAFMHLADYDELLISHRIWTETEHIEQQLANLTEHMENVFQKYLRNEFNSIEEYNERAGEVAEPYRILIVANFPAGFSERGAQRLASIAASGARCGVFLLGSVDMRQTMPAGLSLGQLDGVTNVLNWQEGHFYNDALPVRLPLVIDEPPPAPLFAALIRKVGELSKDVRRVEVPFHRIVPREESYWTADSRSSVDVPLGRAGATKLQHLRLGQGTSQHVLLAGKTGSGKSTLLHVIVTDLALRYSPDEVEFYLIDFKKGVEFKTYATHRLPHARVIAIESDREFGTSVLERLDTILKERGDLFRQKGVQDIASFRDACPDVRMPRMLLIVDEFQEFFVEDDRYSQTAALLLDRLVRQGRAFGIHVLLGSQTLGGAYSLARTTVGQMAVRIALQCSETDAHLILSEENSAARLLTRPGEAIYNDANGLLEGNHPFQVAWLDDGQRDDFLHRIDTLASLHDRRWPEAIVFEGNIPADPARNRLFCELVASNATRGPAEPAGVVPPRAWLGEAVAITGPAAVTFSRRSGANLLIVGQDADAALGMLTNALVALAAQHGDSTGSICRFHLLAGEAMPAQPQRWARCLSVVPPCVRLADPDAAGAVVAEIAAEVHRRQNEPAAAPSLFLIIDDISRFRDLRKSEDDFGFGGFDKEKTATSGQLFGAVLRDGPAVGVHVVVWCDSYNNVDRWFSRQMLREFEMRVVLQMSAGDSSNLIDSPAAARLGTNRAILYSDERGTTEKFRPYGPPSEEWLAWLAQQLPPAPAEDLSIADDIDLWVVT